MDAVSRLPPYCPRTSVNLSGGSRCKCSSIFHLFLECGELGGHMWTSPDSNSWLILLAGCRAIIPNSMISATWPDSIPQVANLTTSSYDVFNLNPGMSQWCWLLTVSGSWCWKVVASNGFASHQVYRSFSVSGICTNSPPGIVTGLSPSSVVITQTQVQLSWNPTTFGINCDGAGNNQYIVYGVGFFDLSYSLPFFRTWITPTQQQSLPH